MFNTIVGAGAVGAGAASRYGSGSIRPKDAAPCGSGSATLVFGSTHAVVERYRQSADQSPIVQ
jgi:hypothetical protein